MSGLRKISSYWWCQVIGWGLASFSILVAFFFFKQPITSEMIWKVMIIMVAGIVSTHLFRLCIKKYNWLLRPIEKVIAPLAIAVVFTCVAYSLLVIGINEAVGIEENRRGLSFLARMFGQMLNGALFIVPWALFYYFYHYIMKSRKQEFDTLKLEALVKELELKTIKSHINPHFIFNALNSIRALIDENPTRARDAVTHLSNILRSSMQAEKLETVPFEKELNIVKDYLALEYIRFEERLNIEYNINYETLASPVPPMMLQTLVENAIKHGISKKVGGGTVKVISTFFDDYHQLEVQNSGELNGHANADGFGLFSTRNRLYLLFGDKANFDISQKGEMVIAKVLIPKV